MNEIIDAILHKYGLWALSLAIVIVWGLAHWTAAPGTPVSVFWGLVTYTKSTTQLSMPDKRQVKIENKPPNSIDETVHEIVPVMVDNRIYLSIRPGAGSQEKK